MAVDVSELQMSVGAARWICGGPERETGKDWVLDVYQGLSLIRESGQ